MSLRRLPRLAQGRSSLLVAALLIGFAWLAIPAPADPRASARDSDPKPAALLQAGTTPTRIFLPFTARRDADVLPLHARVGGTTRALATAGDRVYAAIDDRIQSYDVSTKSDFRPITVTAQLGSHIEALALAGDALYAAAGPAGLFTFDIGDPDQPLLAHAQGIGSGALDLAVHGNSLLILGEGDKGGLLVYGLGDPLRPALAGRLADIRARHLAVGQNRAYLSQCGRDIAVVGLDDPKQPKLLARVGESCPAEVPDFRFGGMTLAGGRLLTVASDGSGQYRQRIFDLADPDLPRPIEGPALGAGCLGGIAAFDGHVYAAVCGPEAGETGGMGGGLLVGRDPGGAQPYAPVGPPLPIVGGLLAVIVGEDGAHVYAGGERANLVAWEIDVDPAAPIISALDQNVWRPGRVAAGRDQIYVIEPDPMSLAIIDTDGPWPPRRLGSFPLVAERLTPDQITLLADPGRRYAYLLYYSTLQIVESTLPDKPAARRLLAMPDITAMALDGDFLYAAGDGLRIIDVFNQDDPKLVAYARQAGNALAVAVEGQRVYTAQREPTGSRPTSLYVWETGDRSKPQRVGQLPDIGPTVGMAALGGFVWHLFDYSEVTGLQARGAALQTIDARSAGAPRELAEARIVIDGHPLGIVRDAPYLYVSEEQWFDRRTRLWRGRTGVRVLDIGQPERPRELRFIPFDTPPQDMDALDGRLYVVSEGSGLVVLDIAEPGR